MGGDHSGGCQGKLDVYVEGLLCSACWSLSGIRKASNAEKRPGGDLRAQLHDEGIHIKGCQV